MADQSNPWGTTEAADSAAQSADAWGSTPAPADGGGAADWLNSAPAPAPEHFNIMDPFHKTLIPLDSWVTEGSTGSLPTSVRCSGDPYPGGLHPERLPAADAGHARAGGDYPVLADRMAVRQRGYGYRHADLPDCHRRDWRVVSGDDHPGAGADRPAVLRGDRPADGDLAGAQPAGRKIIRPLLDAMQTTPAFVYPVPIVMLFGIGNVPGVVVTIIFALPPIIRLTILGINRCLRI